MYNHISPSNNSLFFWFLNKKNVKKNTENTENMWRLWTCITGLIWMARGCNRCLGRWYSNGRAYQQQSWRGLLKSTWLSTRSISGVRGFIPRKLIASSHRRQPPFEELWVRLDYKFKQKFEILWEKRMQQKVLNSDSNYERSGAYDFYP